MSHLLDTNIVSAHLRRPSGLGHRFTQHGGRLYISTIALAELYTTVFHLKDRASRLLKFEQLLIDLHVLDFDVKCAERFGRVRGTLLIQGISIPTADLMIASVALVHDVILVTNNTADFRHVPALRLEDWLTP